MIGACRNMLEEVLLQDDGMTENALLLIESTVSLLTAIIAGYVLVKVLDPNIKEYFRTYTTSKGVIPTLCIFALFMYGKDLGKLKLTKFSSAVTAKIVSLVFPFGTWTLSILFYYCVTEGKEHPIGDGLNMPWSFLRLAGFITIVVSVWFFKFAAQARKFTKQTLRGSYDTYLKLSLLDDAGSEKLIQN